MIAYGVIFILIEVHFVHIPPDWLLSAVENLPTQSLHGS
jgi:hypothetical protein